MSSEADDKPDVLDANTTASFILDLQGPARGWALWRVGRRPFSDRDRLAIFAPDRAKRVADLADGNAGLDGGENTRQQIFGAVCGILYGGQGCVGGGGIAR